MLSPRISLGEFLRSRRERLVPEDAGLPSHGRRRTLDFVERKSLNSQISEHLGTHLWNKAEA